MAKILIVDDDEAVRGTIANMLVTAGHLVAESEDGNAGLASAARSAFDLALVDILMPDKEGIETIIELRHQYPALRIVGISGGGRVDFVDFLRLAKELGADATLRKPIHMKELLSTVSALLD